MKDVKKFNCALLAKWEWRLQSDEKGKWKDVLISKYGTTNGNVRSQWKMQSWWWKDLKKVCGEGEGRGWFQQALTWKVGIGDKVRFWEDAWVENVNLKTLYPRLYSLSLEQGLKIVEVGEWGEEGWQWQLEWRRARFEWEVVLEEEMLRYVEKGSMNKEVNDCILWRGDALGVFSVKSAYDCMNSQVSSTTNSVFKMLWQTEARPSAQTTAWKVLLDRLPTKGNLIRRGVQVTSPLCVFCHESDESVQHLLCECKFTHRVWTFCSRWIGIEMAHHNDPKRHFENFHLVHCNLKQNQVWKGTWVAIVRCIWDQRNVIIFRQGVPDAEEVFHSAQMLSWLWLKHKVKPFIYALSDWILNPNQCIRSCG